VDVSAVVAVSMVAVVAVSEVVVCVVLVAGVVLVVLVAVVPVLLPELLEPLLFDLEHAAAKHIQPNINPKTISFLPFFINSSFKIAAIGI
jgi:hypothetical protein